MDLPQDNKGRSILLFDGVCNLCSGAVQFVIKRDQKDRFRFAALQADAGKTMLKQIGFPENHLSTFVLIEGHRAYTQSTAALRVAKKLGGLLPAFYVFIIVPKFIRDAVYKLISNNRYRMFGKKDACMMPTPELKKKFL